MIYTICNPETDDCRDFHNKAQAIRFAKKQDYTPVFIDITESEQGNSYDYIKIENKGKRQIN